MMQRRAFFAALAGLAVTSRLQGEAPAPAIAPLREPAPKAGEPIRVEPFQEQHAKIEELRAELNELRAIVGGRKKWAVRPDQRDAFTTLFS